MTIIIRTKRNCRVLKLRRHFKSPSFRVAQHEGTPCGRVVSGPGFLYTNAIGGWHAPGKRLEVRNA